jgi:GNAT superfamily N-acetyltransferase
MDDVSVQIVVCPLDAGRLADWLTFFDNDAFADNPDWSGCYCHWFHADTAAKPWDERTPGENRAASIDLIRKGHLQGYLAYSDGRPVGWCQAAPRCAIPNIANDDDLAVEDADSIGSVVCFLVAEPFRGRGVASALLEASCEGFRAAGLRTAEAYPRQVADSAAANYHGPLALYANAGFKPYREAGDLVIMRRDLGEGKRVAPLGRGAEGARAILSTAGRHRPRRAFGS